MKKPTIADMALNPLPAHPVGTAPVDYQDSSKAARSPQSPPSPPSSFDGTMGNARKRRPPSAELAQFILRMPWDKRRRIHQLALELDMSAQDLFLKALDEYLDRRALRPLG